MTRIRKAAWVHKAAWAHKVVEAHAVDNQPVATRETGVAILVVTQAGVEVTGNYTYDYLLKKGAVNTAPFL